MGRKGDLLELIDGAPDGLSSLTGSIWKWTHHERSRRAVEAVTRRSNGNVAYMRSSFGGPPGQATDEHLRVALALPDRWRMESSRRVDVCDGSTRWLGHPGHLTEFTGDEAALGDTELGILIEPGRHLFGVLEFGDPAEGEIAGRDCMMVEASIVGRHPAPRLMMSALRIGGVDHTFWFDAAAGIVLRHVGRIDGAPCSITEFTEVRIDPLVADRDFAYLPVPGTIVERRVDQLVRMAEAHGIDMAGVDLADPDAVQQAINTRLRHGQPTPEARLRALKAKHVPVGDPPAEEATARAAIEYAFNNLSEADTDGVTLVNVQSGRGLVGPLRDAQKRVPGAADSPASLIVDDVRFLRPDEAVVWYSVEVNGQRFPMVNGREGRAVEVAGRWLIEHATIADLLGFAGVAVPSPDN